ncbi:MAG TPA: DeoR/GlpR transcriptional regulator [Clostridiales bacterium]|nr:DeoR/GlpR transcriptional regulator [Clostridiales bacterium]
MRTALDDIRSRRNKIVELIKKNNSCSVTQLTEELKTSGITIRRDLAHLEKQGVLIRYHGGAKLKMVSDIMPGQLPTGSGTHSEIELRKKEAIARKMAELITDSDTIFINSSSTACNIYSYIKNKSVTVITNNCKSIFIPKDPCITLILTGGEVNPNKSSLTGQYSLETIEKVTCDKCIIGVSGISIKNGITTAVLNETTINHAMIKRCKGPVYVVADSSKIGAVHKFYSGEISEITHLITDTDADSAVISQLQSYGIQTVLVNY